MAKDYSITGQTMGTERQPDGTYEPVVEVSYRTNGTPPVLGTVAVPQSLLKDRARYAETVRAAVEEAVGAHTAVAEL